MNDGWGISRKTALGWMLLDLTDNKSTLAQLMGWCRQATSHYLSQCWPRFMSPYGVARPQWVNRLRAFTYYKRTGVLPPNLVTARGREIGCYDDRIVPGVNRHLGSTAMLPRCLSNFRAIRKSRPEPRGFEISRDFAVRRPPLSD